MKISHFASRTIEVIYRGSHDAIFVDLAVAFVFGSFSFAFFMWGWWVLGILFGGAALLIIGTMIQGIYLSAASQEALEARKNKRAKTKT